MGLEEEESRPIIDSKIGDFYNNLQKKMIEYDENDKLCYITSRSTEENKLNIELICNSVKYNCKCFGIPTEGVFLKKTELCVKAFKYLICNTNFDLQSLLADDTANGHLVDMHPPFSVYLLIEILWHCSFEDILAESILHFPLDICLQILEVLPRCIDLLDFQRATKFLTTIIPNAYKKLIVLTDTGTQTQDVNEKAFAFSSHINELILQFTNTWFLKFEDVPVEERFKRQGMLLKSIIQMVRLCFTSKSKKVENPIEMEKLYRLTFGHVEFRKMSVKLLQKLLLDIDRKLISLLVKKIKEIDCNIYINWTEYDDQDNTAINLQRGIGLESYFFIENTKDLVSPELKEYQHLVECLGQLASQPNSIESLQLKDLAHGVGEGKKEFLVALFRRYKEWDDSIVDSVDSHISLLTKEDCEGIFEYLADEIVCQTHPVKLQTCLLCLSKALVFLDITELYEITVKFILKFGDNDNLENVIDITNFERFMSLNPNISVSKNLRVVLFFLCLKPKASLKIIVKMAIGHTDYPDVAVSIDDLMLLEPIMKIQTRRRDDTLIDALRHKCSEKIDYNNFVCVDFIREGKLKKPYSVSLVVRVLRDICLDATEWNFNKFTSLLKALYTICNPSEFVWEIFVPLLLSDRCTVYQLNYILMEMKRFQTKLIISQDTDCNDAAAGEYEALIKRGIWLLKARDISKYIINDCLSIIQHLIWRLVAIKLVEQCYPCNYYCIFLSCPDENMDPINIQLTTTLSTSAKYYGIDRLDYRIATVTSSHQSMAHTIIRNPRYSMVFVDDVLRFMMTMCTKRQYLEYIHDMLITSRISKRHGGLKADRCDWIIRLTLETCLLCLEFPMIAAPDTLSFLLKCLQEFLSIMRDTEIGFNQQLCESLNRHLQIFQTVVPYTIIFEAFTELVNKCEEFKDNFPVVIHALAAFSLRCSKINDHLKNYGGPNSPLGVKLYLAYDIVSMAMDQDSSREEEYLKKLYVYFKNSEEQGS